MKFTDAEFVKSFMRMAFDGWEQGWHERNGGNLTYRVKPEEVESVKENFVAGEWRNIGATVPKLAKQYFLATGSGKFFRNIIERPEDSFCLIEIDETGTKYRIVWGMVNGGVPTSEIPAHLMSHEIKMELTNGENRLVYHAHPANTIALTYVLPLEDEAFTRELWESNNECIYIFPQGVGVLPWMICGGEEIAKATHALMNKYDVVVWAHHGVFVTGPDFDTTFGLMHTVEKTAEILVKVMSMCDKKRQTISAQNFRAVSDAAGLNIEERFLFEK